MKEVIVKSQVEFDALPQSFTEQTVITIRCDDWIGVSPRENSHVEAWGNSHVVAWGNSHVVARESSHVEAWENSHVVARENSHVEARESSHVEAWGNSHVVAWENSHVVARENSHVVARGNTCTWNFSVHADVTLFIFAVCFLFNKAKAVKKSKNATIITPKSKSGVSGWMESQAIKEAKTVILFKRVSKDFKTQGGTANETLWKIGSTLNHPAWNPGEKECGEGKFHACSRPYFCDQFRDVKGDVYIAIEIAKKDLKSWPNPKYPHKIAFRKGTVLHQCDRFGKEIK